MLIYLESVVYTLSHQPGYAVATAHYQLVLLVKGVHLTVGEIIAHQFLALHAQGYKPVARLISA